MKRHRWGEKVVVSPYKSEQQCLDCKIVMAHRVESEGGWPKHWDEFWRGLDKIEGKGRPACEPVAIDEVAA